LLLRQNNLLNEFYEAGDDDKKIFGPQNFLNCKTIRQYINCYANFVLKKTETEKEIIDELNLVKNAKVIYSRDGWNDKLFKQKIIQKILRKSNKNKKKIILKILKTRAFARIQK
jgi:hypothetical protein